MDELRDVDIGEIKWFDKKKKHGAISPLAEEEVVLFYLDDDDDRAFREGQMVQFVKKKKRFATQAKEIATAEEIVTLD